MTKVLDTNVGPWVKGIRNSAGRKLSLPRAKVESLPGRKTVLRLVNNHQVFGLVRAKTQQEANRLLGARLVTLTIGWDKNRNEQVMANFTY